ncbi:MAG: DUF975 family protein [Chitinophagales bacterium]
MKAENKELRQQAREALKGKWGIAVGCYAVYVLFIVLTTVFSAGTEGGTNISVEILQLILGGSFSLGYSIFSLSLARGEEARFSQIFEGFRRFGTALGTYLLMTLFIILWALLLIIPGIIAALSYSQTFYVLADNKSIGAMEAIDASKKMMYGNKEQYFALILWFVLLIILSVLTLGIALFWIFPYMSVTLAKFYEDVKETEQHTDLTLIPLNQ